MTPVNGTPGRGPKRPLRVLMNAYDRLPPQVRQILANAHDNFDAENVLVTIIKHRWSPSQAAAIVAARLDELRSRDGQKESPPKRAGAGLRAS